MDLVAENTGDLEAKGRLRRAADAIGGLAKDVLVEVGAKVLEHQSAFNLPQILNEGGCFPISAVRSCPHTSLGIRRRNVATSDCPPIANVELEVTRGVVFVARSRSVR